MTVDDREGPPQIWRLVERIRGRRGGTEIGQGGVEHQNDQGNDSAQIIERQARFGHARTALVNNLNLWRISSVPRNVGNRPAAYAVHWRTNAPTRAMARPASGMIGANACQTCG